MKNIPTSFVCNNLRLCVVLFFSLLAANLFTATADPCDHQTTYSGGTTITGNEINDIGNGYNYQLWFQEWDVEEVGSMTFFGGDADCAFKASWNESNDFLARVGYYDETISKSYTDLGVIAAEYNYIKTGTGGECSYIGVHGWAKNPTIEYYIVDDSFSPDGEYMLWNTQKIGSYTADGATYTLYRGERNNAPSIMGDNRFIQLYAMRSSFRTCGHISVSEHFQKWEEIGIIMGKIHDCKILCEVCGGQGSIEYTFATMSWKGKSGHLDNDGETQNDSINTNKNPNATTLSNDMKDDTKEYALYQNTPNPVSSGETNISYNLASNGHVTLSLYNTLGVKIMDIVNGQESEGIHTVTINVESLPSGIYLYVLNVDGFTLQNNMIIK